MARERERERERETTSTGRYLGLEMLEAIEPLAPPEHGFKH